MPVNCAACKKPITGDSMEVNGKEYHDACFVCAKCKKEFPDGEFFDEPDGKFYHEACLPKAGSGSGAGAGAAAVNTTTEIHSCNGCSKQFANKEEYMVVKPKDASSSTKPLYYHDKCFCCAECGKQIGNQPYGVSNGKPIHAEGPCAHGAIVSKTQGSHEFEEDLNCEACGERVRGRKKQFELNGKVQTYHLTCLKCSSCGLGITQDIYLVNDKPVCHRCKK